MSKSSRGSASIYFSNFDDSEFQPLNSTNLNRSIYDDCAEQLKNVDNSKKLKFVTTNYADLLNAQEEKNFFGIATKDYLFVPSDKIDSYSELLDGREGNKLTNCNIKTDLGQLPLSTMPFKGQLAHGDTEKEDVLRNHINYNKYSCERKPCEAYQYTFQVFENTGAEIPQPIKSVESVDSGFLNGRVGVNTRLINP